jgi:hypothetical protein
LCLPAALLCTVNFAVSPEVSAKPQQERGTGNGRAWGRLRKIQENTSPTISGTPDGTVLENSYYEFVPSAWDPDGNSLTFMISNKPGWADFDPKTGALYGTPNATDVGPYNGIQIAVSDGIDNVKASAFSIEVLAVAPDPNLPPAIAGTPPGSILAKKFYEFVPDASDPDGDALTFRVSNKPGWADFDPTAGALYGTPTAADVGRYGDIQIAVSDGLATAELAGFAIDVTATAMGSATVQWQPPTDNTDGTPLTDLAGYRIYYGVDPTVLSDVIELPNPGLTSHVVENLSPDTWYFAMTSLNSGGLESDFSNPVAGDTR